MLSHYYYYHYFVCHSTFSCNKWNIIIIIIIQFIYRAQLFNIGGKKASCHLSEEILREDDDSVVQQSGSVPPLTKHLTIIHREAAYIHTLGQLYMRTRSGWEVYMRTWSGWEVYWCTRSGWEVYMCTRSVWEVYMCTRSGWEVYMCTKSVWAV